MLHSVRPLLSLSLLPTGTAYGSVREFISAETVGTYFQDPVCSGLYLRKDSCGNFRPRSIEIWDGNLFPQHLGEYDFGDELCFDMKFKKLYGRHVKYLSVQEIGFRRPVLNGLWIRTDSFQTGRVLGSLRVCLK